MSDAMLRQLRESILLERAHKVVRISRADELSAIELVRDILRITRDEGIAAGLKQAETHGHLLEKVS